MSTDTLELDQMQAAYKAAVEEWIAAIKEEEALASVNHTVAEVDQWEACAFQGRRHAQEGEGGEETLRRRAARKVLRLLARRADARPSRTAQ